MDVHNGESAGKVVSVAPPPPPPPPTTTSTLPLPSASLGTDNHQLEKTALLSSICAFNKGNLRKVANDNQKE